MSSGLNNLDVDTEWNDTEMSEELKRKKAKTSDERIFEEFFLS